MADEIGFLREAHLGEAAGLVSSKFRAERALNPSLPVRYENPAEILVLLRELAAGERGVAVESGGRLAGFMLGMPIPDWRGHRAAWSPEWANAAAGGNEAGTYYAMYERIAPAWMADGRQAHLVSVFSHDDGAAAAMTWLGFGHVALDAMRGLDRVEPGGAGLEIVRAGAEDAGTSLKLSRELASAMEEPPIFLYRMKEGTEKDHEVWLADSRNALFLGRRDGELVGYIRLVPSNPNAAYLIRDKGTMSISGAYVKRELRGGGIGTALLAHCINWIRRGGYERCSVDFEPENVRGRAFWLMHFKEFCRTYCRHIDGRFMAAGR